MVAADIQDEWFKDVEEIRTRLQTGDWSDLGGWYKSILWDLATFPCSMAQLEEMVSQIRRGLWTIPEGHKNDEPDYDNWAQVYF